MSKQVICGSRLSASSAGLLDALALRPSTLSTRPRNANRGAASASRSGQRHSKAGRTRWVPFIEEVTDFDKRLLTADSNAQDAIITQGSKRRSCPTTLRNGGSQDPQSPGRYSSIASVAAGAADALARHSSHLELRVEPGRHRTGSRPCHLTRSQLHGGGRDPARQ